MNFRTLIGYGLAAASVPVLAAALPGDPTGRWGDKNLPAGNTDYLVQSDAKSRSIKVQLPDTIKIPSGSYVVLKQTNMSEWRSALGTNPVVVFNLTGPNTAHISLKGGEKGASFFSGWAVYNDDVLIRR